MATVLTTLKLTPSWAFAEAGVGEAFTAVTDANEAKGGQCLIEAVNTCKKY